MKTSKYTNTSRKIVALALAFVLIVTMFVGCSKSKDDETTTTTTTTESQAPIETEFVTDESGETVTDDSGIAVTETITQSDKTIGDSATSNVPVSHSQTENTTKKNVSTGSNETTTKNNASSGSSSTVCSHSWSEYKWGTTEATYGNKYRTCSKCGKSESWRECSHSFGKWTDVRLGCQERECSKCGWTEDRDADNAQSFMGNKSEYLELLRYVNQARREAGLNELVYLDEFQQGANTRAQELTVKFSHTRPNGSASGTAYSYSSLYLNNYIGCGENIVANAPTAKSAFNSWMNSEGHRKTILSELATHFVCARCDGYWVMNCFY